MNGVRALRLPAVAGVGPGLLASLVIAAAAAFLADHYGGPVMLFALLLGMAMNFLSDVDRCKAGHRLRVADRASHRRRVARLPHHAWRDRRTRLAAGRAGRRRRVADHPRFDLGGAGRWASSPSSDCCRAAPPRSAALRRPWRFRPRCPPHPLKERATLFTIIGVSTLSTLAMILYPAISQLFGFDDHHAGIFIGATIHDVAQVVGAGYAISPEAGDTATVVKLMRVAMLLPVIVAVGLWARAHGGHGEGERPPLLPWFVARLRWRWSSSTAWCRSRNSSATPATPRRAGAWSRPSPRSASRPISGKSSRSAGSRSC